MTITRGTSVEPAWRFLAFADPNKSNVVSLDTDDNEITLFVINTHTSSEIWKISAGGYEPV